MSQPPGPTTPRTPVWVPITIAVGAFLVVAVVATALWLAFSSDTRADADAPLPANSASPSGSLGNQGLADDLRDATAVEDEVRLYDEDGYCSISVRLKAGTTIDDWLALAHVMHAAAGQTECAIDAYTADTGATWNARTSIATYGDDMRAYTASEVDDVVRTAVEGEFGAVFDTSFEGDLEPRFTISGIIAFDDTTADVVPRVARDIRAASDRVTFPGAVISLRYDTDLSEDYRSVEVTGHRDKLGRALGTLTLALRFAETLPDKATGISATGLDGDTWGYIHVHGDIDDDSEWLDLPPERRQEYRDLVTPWQEKLSDADITVFVLGEVLTD